MSLNPAGVISRLIPRNKASRTECQTGATRTRAARANAPGGQSQPSCRHPAAALRRYLHQPNVPSGCTALAASLERKQRRTGVGRSACETSMAAMLCDAMDPFALPVCPCRAGAWARKPLKARAGPPPESHRTTWVDDLGPRTWP